MRSSREHYETLLADHYTWLYGGLENKLAENTEFFRAQGIRPRGNGRAADLGAGSGFQSLPLALAGFAVDAVDLSPTLLAELADHARQRGVALLPADSDAAPAPPKIAPGVRPLEADLVEFLKRAADSYELLVCMGDTLPHLESFAAATAFLESARQKLEAGGRLVLSFRDLSQPLAGLDRFIPVQNDAERIFTCFLEYEREHVVVHDLIYLKVDGAVPGWRLHKSHYRKLRIGTAWVTEQLLRFGFRIAHESSVRGFTTIIAQ